MELMIGEKLKKLRRNRDLTQEEVATHLGISYQAISKWERGDGYPDITMLPALANYFAVSVDELIGMEEITSASKLDEIIATSKIAVTLDNCRKKWYNMSQGDEKNGQNAAQ